MDVTHGRAFSACMFAVCAVLGLLTAAYMAVVVLSLLLARYVEDLWTRR